MKLVVLLYIACIVPTVLGAATKDATASGEGQLALHQERETNAERFRRGLGPLPPTRRDRNDLSPRASAAPCTRLSNNVGTLQVRRVSDGNTIGYLSKHLNRENAYTVHKGPGDALRFTVPPATPFGKAINLIAAGAPPGFEYLGAVEDGQGNLGSGEAAVAILAATMQGTRPPSFSAGTSLTLDGLGGIETQIWKLNCLTRQILAQWTNSDSSQPVITIFFDEVRDLLALTGDLEAYLATLSPPERARVFEVTIIFLE
ncbi:hypothetical protein DFH06DRAFT_1334957 [Mycena polygramma]|nr:hypothetical protein DFH06DRAFT_1334957 [Mycena polygramma]